MKSIVNELLKESKTYNSNILNRDKIIKFVNNIRNILFIGYYEEIDRELSLYINDKLEKIELELKSKMKKMNMDECIIGETTSLFLKEIPNLKKKLNGDLNAFLISDPAVYNEDEIILSYPGFYAISIYRIANVLANLDIPFLPRIISEHAHSKTGIDIHPKAIIKENFFIDHGTGVVIGETTEIGSNVKIYQGVTLGALSLNNIEQLKNTKRHPTIEDNVIIYSGTSILGGQTVIGENSIIGSNVFITKSIEPSSKVIFTNYDQLHMIKENKK